MGSWLSKGSPADTAMPQDEAMPERMAKAEAAAKKKKKRDEHREEQSKEGLCCLRVHRVTCIPGPQMRGIQRRGRTCRACIAADARPGETPVHSLASTTSCRQASSRAKVLWR